MAKSGLSVDLESYATAVQKVGVLSRLFSDSATPLIHPRFIERLYVQNTLATDLSRTDISYDAKQDLQFGIGVKTFVANPNAKHSLEKVAEFTADANRGDFQNLSTEEFAHLVATRRNLRVSRDAINHNIDTATSIYHCLVRVPGGCFVLEEPYELIDASNLKPVDKFGKALRSWPKNSLNPAFTDGTSFYSFNTAKSVLMKRFVLQPSDRRFVSPFIEVKIDSDPLASLLELTFNQLSEPISTPQIAQHQMVLPLYATRTSSEKYVQGKSAINQWNAAGRVRVFGEAYIPVPARAKSVRPGFFPPRDTPFKLHLPNGKTIEAKICQDGSKALMANPNKNLIDWLYEVLDGSLTEAEKRFHESRPYTYQDLELLGKDSVLIHKLNDNLTEYAIDLMPLGSYEDFLDENEIRNPVHSRDYTFP